MQSYETLTEIHARRLLALMKITDSHRRNLVEYGEALSIDEHGEEDEDEKHHDETYICDHPGSDGGAGEVLETTRKTPPLLLLGHGRVPPGSGATPSSIAVCSKKAQHEPPLLKRGSCVSMFNVISTSGGWNENDIVDFYHQNMDEEDDGEEEEDDKLPTSPEEEVVLVAASAVVPSSKEICKTDTSCASALGEQSRKQKNNSSNHRRKRRRRSSRFSFKSPTRNFQSMFFPDLVCGK